ncbi:MAG: 30S ribosomal protein S8e [archaeon]
MNKGRKISGGKYHAHRKKKLYERQGQERHVMLGENKTKIMRVKGGNTRVITLRANSANIVINGKAKKAQITNVTETPQNKFFARQNRLMKGAIIETSLGKARITNRPTQEGCINAILVPEKK